MSLESAPIHVRAARSIKERACKFGTVVRALWPNKPALHLTQLEGCSERGAQYQIDGERKVTAKAMHVVEGEMLDGQI
jgi:hypothetical protein